jgi:hypothetical protein
MESNELVGGNFKLKLKSNYNLTKVQRKTMPTIKKQTTNLLLHWRRVANVKTVEPYISKEDDHLQGGNYYS